jgi:inorganic phosphate transporter, PiT family
MLGPRRAIAILLPSFVIAQIGIFSGFPRAFNQIFIAAIAGTGYAVGAKTVSECKLIVTTMA